MAVLEFKGYSVKEQSYKRNEKFEQTQKEILLNPKIEISNQTVEDGILVTLGVQVGSLKGDPFEVIVKISGEFHYHPDQDNDNIGVDYLIRTNAVAILYPYVRMIVSNLTNTSNEYPTFTLPTIDVAQVLKEQASSSELAD